MRCRSLRGGRRINVLYLRCWPEALCIEWSGSVPQLHGPSEHAAVSVPVFVSASVPGGGLGWFIGIHTCCCTCSWVLNSFSYTGWIL